MRRCWRWLLTTVLLASPVVVHGQRLINFDDAANGDDVTARYPGLTFSCEGARCASARVFARMLQGATPPSTPNVVSPVALGSPPGVSHSSGFVRVALATPSSSVSVSALTTPFPETGVVQHAVLIARDAAGTVVGQATGASTNTWETLSVSTTGDRIASVTLGLDGTVAAAAANFDDLRIGPGGGPWSVDSFGGRANMLWILFGIATLVTIGIVVVARRRRPGDP